MHESFGDLKIKESQTLILRCCQACCSLCWNTMENLKCSSALMLQRPRLNCEGSWGSHKEQNVLASPCLTTLIYHQLCPGTGNHCSFDPLAWNTCECAERWNVWNGQTTGGWENKNKTAHGMRLTGAPQLPDTTLWPFCAHVAPQHIDSHQILINGDLNLIPLSCAEERRWRHYISLHVYIKLIIVKKVQSGLEQSPTIFMRWWWTSGQSRVAVCLIV